MNFRELRVGFRRSVSGLLQQVMQRQFFVLDKCFRKERGDAAFQNDRLFRRQTVAHRDAPIGIVVGQIDTRIRKVLFEERFCTHGLGSGVLAVVEEDADTVAAESRARLDTFGLGYGFGCIAVFGRCDTASAQGRRKSQLVFERFEFLG